MGAGKIETARRRAQYLQSIPWWWDGLLQRPYIRGGDQERCYLRYCSEIATGRILSLDDLQWRTDAF